MTMQSRAYFNAEQLAKVDEAGSASEDLVNSFFKMSSGKWLKNRYDIKTLKDLAPHEIVDGPVAQVIKYEVKQKDVPFGSLSFNLYKVCLIDDAILTTIGRQPGLKLAPFLLYALTHELVHVVRFSKYEQRYEKKNESDVTMEEERKVHLLTYKILQTVPAAGMIEVFDFYRDWYITGSV
jgi:hypothetical protein